MVQTLPPPFHPHRKLWGWQDCGSEQNSISEEVIHLEEHWHTYIHHQHTHTPSLTFYMTLLGFATSLLSWNRKPDGNRIHTAASLMPIIDKCIVKHLHEYDLHGILCMLGSPVACAWRESKSYTATAFVLGLSKLAKPSIRLYIALWNGSWCIACIDSQGHVSMARGVEVGVTYV